MVRIPEAQFLPRLKKARVTYPYHCCAIKQNGFGEVYYNENDPNEEKELFSCATGESAEHITPGWLDDLKVITPEPDNSTFPETIYHETILDYGGPDGK